MRASRDEEAEEEAKGARLVGSVEDARDGRRLNEWTGTDDAMQNEVTGSSTSEQRKGNDAKKSMGH